MGSCSIDELQQMEQQLERSVSNVRARKVSVINKPMEFCLQNFKLIDLFES